jgi:hypothetical protein
MKKKNNRPIDVKIISYGRYAEWDRESDDIPKFIDLTTEIVAEIGVEFGMLVEIGRAKGRYLDFMIDHPPFTDSEGNIEPPFVGTFRVKHNPFEFFLGDTIWEPVHDKRGDWKLSILLDDEVLATKTIRLV